MSKDISKDVSKDMNEDCFQLQDDCSVPAGETCALCADYAERLAPLRSAALRPASLRSASGTHSESGTTRAESEVTMPASLRQRLRAIPLTEKRPAVPSQQIYEDALAHALGNDGDPEVAGYLAHHPVQAKVHAAVTETVRHERRPRALPRAVRHRLSRLSSLPSWSQPRLPLWISDVRYAAAACYLLSSLLMFVVQDAQALVQETVHAVSERSVVWAEHGQDYQQTLFETITGELEDQWNGGRETVHSWAESGSDIWSRTWQDIEKTAFGRWWTEAYDQRSRS